MVPWYLFDWGGSKAARCSQYIAAKVLNQIIMKISECRAITSIISPANQDIFNKLSIYFILRSDLPPVETCRICRSSTVCQGKGMSASGRSRRLHRLDFMWQKDKTSASARWHSWCSWRDPHSHAITSPQSLLSDAISADGLRRYWYQPSVSLCVFSHCQPPHSQFNIMSAWP